MFTGNHFGIYESSTRTEQQGCDTEEKVILSLNQEQENCLTNDVRLSAIYTRRGNSFPNGEYTFGYLVLQPRSPSIFVDYKCGPSSSWLSRVTHIRSLLVDLAPFTREV